MAYTVTYDGINSESGAAPVDSTEYTSTGTVTVLGNTGSLVRTGYVFNGWNDAVDGSGTAYVEGNTFIITADTTLYAQWLLYYTVTYIGDDSESGSVPVDSTHYTPIYPIQSATVLGNTGNLIRTGYTFCGWSIGPGGSGTAYSVGELIPVEASIVLHANWAFTVSYSGNGNTAGTAPVDSAYYGIGSQVGVLYNTGEMTRPGYVFSHWNTKADGSGTDYAPSATITMSENVTLYAVWTAVYTIIYHSNGGDSGTAPVDNTEYNNLDVITILDNTGELARSGYDFKGWCVSIDGSGTIYTSGQTITVTAANIILYAVWSHYNIIYNANVSTSGTVPVDSNYYNSLSIVTLLGNVGFLKKSGYIFSGWSLTSGGAVIGTTSISITADTTLYAVWVESTTSKIYTNKGTIVDAALIGSNIIKCSEMLASNRMTLNLYNTSVTAGLENSSYLQTINTSGDVYNQVTSTGIVLKGSNIITAISGYIDISCSTLSGKVIVDIHDSQANPIHNYLVNTIVAYTTAGTYRFQISSLQIKVVNTTQMHFYITAESGTDIAVVNTSLMTLNQS